MSDPRLCGRDWMAEKLFGPLRGKRVLVIGIGGGGDIVGALPTLFDLRRAGAETLAAGLSWKRRVHDTNALPRRITEFVDIAAENDLIGRVSAETRTLDGVRQVESHIAAFLSETPVFTIDITPGANAVALALSDLCAKHSIDSVIGIDVGGDVLAHGDEPTVESPICDQIMLAALSQLPDSMLGVFGFGSDGELPLAGLVRRMGVLLAERALMGGLALYTEDFAALEKVLEGAKTESSRVPIHYARALPASDRERIERALLKPDTLMDAAGHPVRVPLRGGSRTGELCALCAFTIYFDPPAVRRSSKFGKLLDVNASIYDVHETLARAGIRTEMTPGSA